MPDQTESLSIELVTPDELKEIVDAGSMDCLACVVTSLLALQHLSEEGIGSF